jgi:molybdate transport system ATP-binding protein
MLEVDVALRRGNFELHARFAAAGGITALFGRSGSGKTTIAQLIAGLLVPERGRIALHGTTLVDARAGIAVPAHRRRIAMVFQEGRLFPHLSVRRNLLFGAWFNDAGTERLDQVIELLGIAHCLGRRPTTLSGGEQRRVAIGRALLAQPRLLILDEPLTGVDAQRKSEILPYLERLRDELETPMLLISHALDDVVRLADNLVLLEAGNVVATGPLTEVLHRIPAGAAYAEAGTVIETLVASVERASGLATLRFADGQLLVPAADLQAGQKLRLHVRARDIALATVEPTGVSMLNVLAARITAIEPGADGVADIDLAVGGTRFVARITQRSAALLSLAPGQGIFALIKSVAFDRSPTVSRLV